jgi:UDPglucose 6-dehydrogenase
MGRELESFLKPERLIFGNNKKVKFLNNFKKFNCPIFFLKPQEAELVKISVNLYLFTNVTFANCMDYYCREKNFKFKDINEAIKLDKRIGINSYLNPSLGISGGHLERDLFTTISSTNNNYVRIFYNALKKVNDSRFHLLINSYNSHKLPVNFDKIIWIGLSYKKDSFSIKNSPFLKFFNYLKKEKKVLNSYDSIYDISNLNYKITSPFSLNKKKKYLLIYNYSNNKDKINLKKILKKNKNIFCLNISLNTFFFKKNFQNYENLF